MKELSSTATMWLQHVDCRMLQLELEGHMLNRERVDTFALYCIEHSEQFFSDSFYLKWKLKKAKTHLTFTKKEKIKENIRKGSGLYSFSVEGFVLSDRVYDHKSYANYVKQYISDPLVAGWRNQSTSIDYPELYRKTLENYPTPEYGCDLVFSILNEPGRKHISYYAAPYDVLEMFRVSICDDDPSMYDVSFRFMIANCCLNESTDRFSEKLANLATYIARVIPNISGRITLSPEEPVASCSSHRRYFNGEWTHQCYGVSGKPVQWTKLPFYFLNGAEWFNLISPIQQMRLPSLEEHILSSKGILCEKLETGTIVLRLKKPLGNADVESLRNVYEVLSDSLCPGKHHMDFSYLYSLEKRTYCYRGKPRLRWEYLPIPLSAVHLKRNGVELIHCPQIILPTDRKRV